MGGIDFSKVDFDAVKPMRVYMIHSPRLSWNFCELTDNGNYIFYPSPMVCSWDMMACSRLGRKHIVLRAGEKRFRIKRSDKL